METLGKMMFGIFVVVGMIVLIASVGLLMAFPIKWTWNTIMPYLFTLPSISWGKTWCIYFLCGGLIRSTHTHQKA